jgi:periplasmic copper chaperone A
VPRLLARGLCTAAIGTCAVVLPALPAAAHVTVQPETATQGGFSAVTFRVPTERDNASTTKLEVTFPADQPLAFFSVKPHPGWTYRVQKAKLPKPVKAGSRTVTEAVSRVTWTASGPAAAIKPGEYDEFSASVGFLPKADQMVFKAVQTYSSGEVVRWIEEAAEGAEEPEHPAPVLALEPAETADVALAANPAASRASEESNADLALGLSIAALAVGLLGGALGGLAFARRGRRGH